MIDGLLIQCIILLMEVNKAAGSSESLSTTRSINATSSDEEKPSDIATNEGESNTNT